MYVIKEPVFLAFNQIITKLVPHRYKTTEHTIVLWQQKYHKTTFTLCVDDFGVNYYSQADATTLTDTLKERYTITTNWDRVLYCGLAR